MAQLGSRMVPLIKMFRAPRPVPPAAAATPAGRAAQQGPPGLAALPLRNRVRRAFEEIPLGPNEARALAALLDAPGAPATELSAACGWLPGGWRTQMILLCQRRRRYFWPRGMGSEITNGAILGALVDYRSDTLGFSPRLDLAHLLREAVDRAG